MTNPNDDPYTLEYARSPKERWPRGPLGYEPSDTPWVSVAIGFCPRCTANARRTTTARGVFNCPGCTYQWYDERVGTQTRSFEDYFSPA